MNAHVHSISAAKGLRSSFLVYTYKGESITPCCIIATGKVKRVFNSVVETSTFDLAQLAVQVDRSFSIKSTNVLFYSHIFLYLIKRVILLVENVQYFKNVQALIFIIYIFLFILFIF